MFNMEYNILDNRTVLVSDSMLRSRESLKKEIDHFFDLPMKVTKFFYNENIVSMVKRR